MPERGTLPSALDFTPHLSLFVVLVFRVRALAELLRETSTLLLADPAVRLALNLRETFRLRLGAEHEVAHLRKFCASGSDLLNGEVVHLERFGLRELILTHFGGFQQLVDCAFKFCCGLYERCVNYSPNNTICIVGTRLELGRQFQVRSSAFRLGLEREA